MSHSASKKLGKKDRYELSSESHILVVIIDREKWLLTFYETPHVHYALPLSGLTHAVYEKGSLHFFNGKQIVQSFASEKFLRDRVAIFIDYFGQLMLVKSSTKT